MFKKHSSSAGFTIIELLIVIVVIAILALITVVAYNGIQSRARAAAVSSDLVNASKKLALYQIDYSTYPIDLTALTAAGIKPSPNTSFEYSVNNTVSPQTFCITATNNTTSYKITEATTPTSGGCAGHGQGGTPAITNLATNPGAEGSGGWLTNNVAYPVSWDTSMKRSGLRSLASSNTNGSTTILTMYALGSSDPIGFPTSGQTTFAMSAYFRAEVPNIAYIIPVYRLSGGYTALASSPTVTGTTTSWTQVSHTFTVPAGADLLRIVMYVSGVSAVPAGQKAWVDDVMVASGSTVQQYSDGSSSNWTWNGTANASTSTGPPL